VGDAPQINVTRAQSRGNDGSVEFCIGANDAPLKSELTSISVSIHCAPGGGRAACLATPGLLLCSYPTQFPGQCATQQGAMTDAAWADMCKISAFPQINEIVPTI